MDFLPFSIALAIIILGSLAGFLFKMGPLRRWTEKNMSFLTSLAAGVFLVTAFFLIREVFELATPTIAIASVVGGFVLFLIIQHSIPESHHHHDEEGCDSHDRRSAYKILLGDALHNIGDGLILVPAFLVSTELGALTAVSIVVHELVQEVSEYFVLRQSGYTSHQALLRNFLVALTILIGVGLGFLIVQSQLLQAMFLGVSAGAFLQIVFHDLIPSHKHLQRHDIAKHIGAFMVGIVMIAVVNYFAPHTHAHEDGHNHDEYGDHDSHEEHEEGNEYETHDDHDTEHNHE